jgi:hypothetical protein
MERRMNQPILKSDLTEPQSHLVELLQEINFGRIEGLHVHRGGPIFQPAPRVVRDVKLGGGENGPRPELAREDFALKSQVVEMFEHLRRLADGTIATIHVQHGLPCRLTVEQPAQ